MSERVQKASIWKRISAFLLDSIIITILATGVAFLTTAVTNYDSYSTAYEEKLEYYQETYNFDISKYSSEDEIRAEGNEVYENYQNFVNALYNDTDAMYNYNMTVSLTMVSVSVSVVASFLIVEFVFPLIFKNGQTIGKKIFGIAVMKNDCTRINNIQLFMRGMVGKCCVETMVPILLFVMVFFLNTLGSIGLIIIAALGIFQLVLCIASKNNLFIHDVFAYTVVVDFSSQKIFKDAEEKLEYEKELAKIEAEKQSY